MELAASAPLRDAFASGRRNGVVRMRSGLDNEMKIVAYRQGGDYSVFVSSGYPVATIWGGGDRRIGVVMGTLFAPGGGVWGVVLVSLGPLPHEEESWGRWQA